MPLLQLGIMFVIFRSLLVARCDDGYDAATEAFINGKKVSVQHPYYYIKVDGEYLICQTCHGDTFFGGFCTPQNHSSQCLPCPEGTHQPEKFFDSHLEQSCQCNDHFTWLADIKECVPCPVCPNGTYAAQNCTTYFNKVVCCKDGEKDNGNKHCQHYKVTSEDDVIKPRPPEPRDDQSDESESSEDMDDVRTTLRVEDKNKVLLPVPDEDQNKSPSQEVGSETQSQDGDINSTGLKIGIPLLAILLFVCIAFIIMRRRFELLGKRYPWLYSKLKTRDHSH